jgi:uncharacterized protein YigE (DUF2233 family)
MTSILKQYSFSIKNLTLYVFFLLSANIGLSQKRVDLVLSKSDSLLKGDSITIEVSGAINCSSETPAHFHVNYSLATGLKDNNNWITWKQKYLDCDDVTQVQQFYLPLCSVFSGSKDVFKNGYINGEPFKMSKSNAIYPSSILHFKQFFGAPDSVKIVSRFSDFLPAQLYTSVRQVKVANINPEIATLSKELDLIVKQIDKLQSGLDKDLEVKLKEIKSKIGGELKFDIKTQLDEILAITQTANDKILACRNEYEKKEKEIAEKLKTVKGECKFNFRSHEVRIYIVDLEDSQIDLFIKNKENVIEKNTFKSVLNYCNTASIQMEMITNGGMFTPSYLPEGLYIDRFNNYYPIDLGSKENTNFYLKPNGVFLIDKKNEASIYTTDQYLKKFGTDRPDLPFATQSGPMLVINEGNKVSIHNAFTEGSPNEKIRSGVGVPMNGSKRVVFAISVDPMNFYDFSLLYKTWLGCESALFLDGAISEMYTGSQDKGILNNQFGPMICVRKK